MCYALSFIFLFTIGGLTGACGWVPCRPTDRLHDTYFVVAHFHYVMVGGTLVGFLGGVFHWWPKMTGKMFSDLWGKISCLFVFVGFNLTFLPQFVLGSRGMPRRYARYDLEFQELHQLSTVGAFVLGVGLFVALGVFIHSLMREEGTAESLGWCDARMAVCFAASVLQFRASSDGQRTVRLQAARVPRCR
jgi:cytochrome c oxidase subunit I